MSPGGTSKCHQDVEIREAQETREDMWRDKVNLGSRVTPRMQGFSAKGRGEELRVTWGCPLVWWV